MCGSPPLTSLRARGGLGFQPFLQTPPHKLHVFLWQCVFCAAWAWIAFRADRAFRSITGRQLASIGRSGLRGLGTCIQIRRRPREQSVLVCDWGHEIFRDIKVDMIMCVCVVSRGRRVSKSKCIAACARLSVVFAYYLLALHLLAQPSVTTHRGHINSSPTTQNCVHSTPLGRNHCVWGQVLTSVQLWRQRRF